MIVGDTQRFAIEAEPETQRVRGWLLGRLRFWIGGIPVGNWNDATDLQGCANRLADFASVPRDRYEAGFEPLSAEDVLRVTCDEYMAGSQSRPSLAPMPVRGIYERFHISHLGMSSFDAVDLVLVFRGDRSERCIWRDVRAGTFGEAVLAPGEMEATASEFCRRFQASVENQAE